MTDRKYERNEKLLRNQYVENGGLNIPKVKKDIFENKNFEFMGFDHVSSKKHGDEGKTIHFFLNDDKFEKVYNNPETYLERLAKYKALLTPDFSLYMDMPIILQMYSIYKNRWCGAYWQDNGIKVIPTVSWSDSRSYDFCFEGIEETSIIAVSTLGVKKEKKLFMKGYDCMLERIKPELILCYDKPFEEMRGEVYYINYLQVTGRAV